MPESIIVKIQNLLDKKNRIDLHDREKLKVLLFDLENEIKYLHTSRIDDAKKLLKVAYKVIYEVEKKSTSDTSDLYDAALGFEVDHPKITYIVQSICQTLANIGI